MPEFTSKMEHIPDDQLQPLVIQARRSENTALYVVAFDNLHLNHDADVFTLPGGELLHANRNSVVPPETDARNIARIHANLIVSAHRALGIVSEPPVSAHGFSVRPATASKIPPHADFRTVECETSPTHKLGLELHRYSQLVKQLEQRPERALDLHVLKLFGELAIGKTQSS